MHRGGIELRRGHGGWGGSYTPLVGITQDRAKLIALIQVEARAFQNADSTVRDMCYGRVLGLLSASTVLGLWPRSASGRASDAIYHGMPVHRINKILRASDR